MEDSVVWWLAVAAIIRVISLEQKGHFKWEIASPCFSYQHKRVFRNANPNPR
jgi:hypothetical protein